MIIDTFRPAVTTDIDAIVQLVNVAYRPTSATAGWTHEADLVFGDRINAVQVEGIIAKRNSLIFVGVSNLDIVACVHIEKDGINSQIGMLAVKPRFQGIGTGKQMLAYAERYVSEKFGSVKITMTVVSSRNELLAFYLRRGYLNTGIVKDYPLSAGVGTPKCNNLRIEVLEKSFFNDHLE